MSARTVLINLVMRDSTRRGADSALRNVDRMGSGMKKAAGTMIASFGAFSAVDFLKDSISAASDLSESMSKSAVVFGKSNKLVMDFASNSAKSLGISRQATIESTATFGNFLQAVGLTQPVSAKMSMSMVKLAGDMASFNNQDPKEVLEALKSGLAGEAEPLKAFGVNVSDAALTIEGLHMGIKKQGTTFTSAQKAQIAYSLIMKQTKTAQGDFARTSGGLANQQRILAAQFMDVKAKIGSFLLPAAISLIHVLTGGLGPAVTNSIKWIKDFAQFMKSGSIYVYMIKGAILSLGATFAVFGAIRLAIMTVTAAQIAWNFAMSANPIGLIVVAIGALVGAVIYAYTHFQGFRNVVQSAWAGIKQAASVAWSVLKVIFTILRIELGILVREFRVVWAVAKAVWAGVSAVIRVAWAIIGPVVRFIAHIVAVVLKNAFILLMNVAKIVWIAIQVHIKVAWFAIRVILNAMRSFFHNVIGPVFHWLYNNVIRPVFSAISSYIRSHWGQVRSVISTVWNSGIKPVFNALKSALGAVRGAFGSAVNGIRSIWNRLIGIAKVPVNFVIGIYNSGLVPLVNGIARLAGIGTRLGTLHKFAGGGVMPGYAPGKDSLLAMVSPGESIFRPEFTKAVGSGWVQQANKVAKRKGTSGVQKWMSGGDRLRGEGIGFANGGIVGGYAGHFDGGGVVGFLKNLGGWVLNAPEKAAKAMLNKVMGGGVPGSGLIRDAIAGIPKWIKNSIWGWIKEHLGGAGGPGMHRALDFAKSQSGKPYVWGGVGPGGYDCSGFMSAITNVIHGKSPYSRMFSTHSFNGLTGPGGFVRNKKSGFRVGVTNAGVGHMAGTLLGVNVESNGSQGVHYGPGARGADNGLFGARYGLMADSGHLSLQRGWNPPVYNGTGRVEHLATGASNGGPPVIANYGVIGSQVELDRWLTKSWERLHRHSKIV